MATKTKKSVLIAEDDALLLKILGERFSEEGFEVTLASNGQEALEALDQKPYCVMLLDLVMPKMSGFEVLQEIKSRKLKIPILVFSNLPKEYNADTVKALGAVAFFEKSEIDDVNEIVNAAKKYGC